MIQLVVKNKASDKPAGFFDQGFMKDVNVFS